MPVSITISGPALDLLKEQRAALESDGAKKALQFCASHLVASITV